MLIILIFAAILSLILNFSTASIEEYSTAWIDGTAILIAVIVVSGVGSVVDWRKEIEFVNRANEGQLANVIDVLRNGEVEELHHNFISVGDILILKYGKEIPVDGLIFMANELTTNEAAMTGESDERRKQSFEQCTKHKLDKEFES
jgi:P-type E1-E2 ATPase